MSEALKQAKVTHRNGKAALTRAGKSLRHTIESKRPATEVRESLAKVQEAYEKLTQKHEELTKLIEDDEEFEKEEMWFEECQEMFVRVEVQAKEYIDETETEKSISVNTKDDVSNDVVETYPGSASPPQNNSGMLGMQSGGNQSINTSAGNTSVVNNQENNPNTAGGSCGFQMEKPKMPRFSGDVREYAKFKADFKHAIESKYSTRGAITFLPTCLQGKPLELIRGIGTDYTAAWEYLDSIYGDPRVVSDTIMQDVVKFKPLRDEEDARFCDLVHLVKRCYNTLKEIGVPGDMDNSPMLSLIEKKMCADDRKVWSRDLEKNGEPATLHHLMTWMTIEMKSRMQATAPLRTSSTHHAVSANCVRSPAADNGN